MSKKTLGSKIWKKPFLNFGFVDFCHVQTEIMISAGVPKLVFSKLLCLVSKGSVLVIQGQYLGYSNERVACLFQACVLDIQSWCVSYSKLVSQLQSSVFVNDNQFVGYPKLLCLFSKSSLMVIQSQCVAYKLACWLAKAGVLAIQMQCLFIIQSQCVRYASLIYLLSNASVFIDGYSKLACWLSNPSVLVNRSQYAGYSKLVCVLVILSNCASYQSLIPRHTTITTPAYKINL